MTRFARHLSRSCRQLPSPICSWITSRIPSLAVSFTTVHLDTNATAQSRRIATTIAVIVLSEPTLRPLLLWPMEHHRRRLHVKVADGHDLAIAELHEPERASHLTSRDSEENRSRRRARRERWAQLALEHLLVDHGGRA